MEIRARSWQESPPFMHDLSYLLSADSIGTLLSLLAWLTSVLIWTKATKTVQDDWMEPLSCPRGRTQSTFSAAWIIGRPSNRQWRQGIESQSPATDDDNDGHLAALGSNPIDGHDVCGYFNSLIVTKVIIFFFLCHNYDKCISKGGGKWRETRTRRSPSMSSS